MRLAPAFKYKLNSVKWAVVIFYIALYALYIFQILSKLLSGRIGFQISGIELASVIFLFVVGLNSFRSDFHLFTANGISRRTMFVSFIAMTVVLSIGMAAIDTINSIILSQIIEYQPIVLRFFAVRYNGLGFALYSEGFLWMVFSYIASLMLGFLITTAYYRMNKPLKMILSIGVPVFFIFILPVIDEQLFSGEISRAIINCVTFCLGIKSHSPYVAMASYIVFAIILGILGYLLMRRATVKLSAE